MKRRSKLFGSLLVFAAASSASASEDLILGNPAYSGEGCPNGSAAVTVSPDSKKLSVIFDRFQVEAGGNTGNRTGRKACNIAIPVRVPAGYSLAVFSIDYRGFTDLPSGARGQFVADYFFAGSRGTTTSQDFFGPRSEEFVTTRNLQAQIWSECGADVVLRSQTSMVVTTNQMREQSMATIDSIDMAAGITYQLAVRPCGDAPQVPPTPPTPPTPTPWPTHGPGPRPRPRPQPPAPTPTPTRPMPPPAPQPTVPPAPPAADRSVIGYVDVVEPTANGAIIRGWACAKTIAQSIDVHVYVGGAAGQGRFLIAARADHSSEGGVAAACQTNFGAYRFNIGISAAAVAANAGQPVFVHGLSPVSTNHPLLARSGEHRFPAPEPEGLFDAAGTLYYSNGQGHACRFDTWERYVALTGRNEANGIRRVNRVPQSLIIDGICQPATPREGIFVVGETWYFSNGRDAYCHIGGLAEVVSRYPKHLATGIRLPILPGQLHANGNCAQ